MTDNTETMTREQIDAWYENRQAAGAVIDVATCEWTWDRVNHWNPYNLRFEPTNDPYNIIEYVEPATELFVRSVGGGDDDWINECDLPDEKRKALHARVEAEQEAEAKAKGFPNHAALVEARLDAWAKEEGFPSYAALCAEPVPF